MFILNKLKWFYYEGSAKILKSKTLKSFLIAMSLVVTTTIIGTFQTAYAAGTVTFNYKTATNSSGSPLLFGGSNEPSPEHNSNVYPKLKGAAFKYQRGTIHMDTLLPSNITLADYKNNVNNVQDPNTWDWTGLQWVDFAKANGITTMLNMFYAPPWLTYSGNAKGVPKDWSVYQDIIKKIITKYGSKLDYVEPLNEPMTSNMLSRSGSPYTSQQTAAKDIYYYTVKAIRAVNTTVQVGGDGDDKQGGDFGALGTILRDTRLSSTDIQFVSYHAYSSDPVAKSQIGAMNTLLSNSGRAGLPIFIDEWNYTYVGDTTDPHVVGNQAATFVGTTLMKFMLQPSVKGAAFMSFLPTNVVLSPYEDCPSCVIKQGLYTWNNNTATLMSQTNAFRLLSSSMKLGAGTFKAYTATYAGVVDTAVGAINSAGNVVGTMVNDTSSAKTVNVNFTNINASNGTRTVTVYIASSTNTGSTATQTFTNVPLTSGNLSISNVSIPAYSVAGIIIN
ncbi:hypothetical protein A8708_28905 [Paenibacillus oryzisoli]|uniref:Glycoside hydrolase family 5 domain-containing protein n=1 Tax=Paenibacillus oryzisoli TaxID=1850517 RepID=A0A198AAA3_9BACL|nr:hypothetical protein A8708_28905 [Paenibacillus oryzisoli]